jgi:ABC-2 type transport system ATP-binding protein
MPEQVLERKIGAMLELFSLGHEAELGIGSYSKGMKQKILIIAALLHDPDILIFDEPLSGLDVTAAMVFRHLVQQLAASGKTILYSSHVLEVVEKLCSKVVVLYRGEVVANDSVEHLRETLARGSLEEVFAQLVFREDPERVARDIADVIANRR